MLLSRIALIIMGIWGIGLLAVLMFGLSFPSQVSASFFSAASIAPPKQFDFFALFIPSNLFRSLAENKVPAIVVFCLSIGAAIIGMQNKKTRSLRQCKYWKARYRPKLSSPARIQYLSSKDRRTCNAFSSEKSFALVFAAIIFRSRILIAKDCLPGSTK